jgi:hypothetical protein
MLFLIEIHWQRRTPEPERTNTGRTTYAEFSKTLTSAKTNATRKFRLHYGNHLAIEKVEGHSAEPRSGHQDPRLQPAS